MSHHDQLFNVNRFSRHYTRKEMNADQVEAMYRKLTEKTGGRMTPHRFRRTLASDLTKQHERNIHVAKDLLNHSNIQTTMSYIETDHDQIRAVINERSLAQGAVAQTRTVDYSGSPQEAAHSRPALPRPILRNSSPSPQVPTAEVTSTRSEQEIQAYNSPPFCTQRRVDTIPLPADNFEQELLFALLAQHLL